MRIQHFAEQKLGPGVDDDNAHRRRFNAQRSTSNAQRPTLNVQRSTSQWFCTEELKFVAKRPTSSGVFILLLANERELFPFDHRAIDRDFSDVFAARHVIHDIEHDALEH